MKGKRQEAKGKRQKWKRTARGRRVLHFCPLPFASCLLPSLEMCLPFDVRHSPDEINLVSLKRAPELVLPRRACGGAAGGSFAGNFNGQAGQAFVSTKGSTSPPKPPTRAEQEVRAAAERLNSQVEDALVAVGARQTPAGIDEIEACAHRLERPPRHLSVALRQLAEGRRGPDNP